MLEVTPDDALDPDVVGKIGHPRAQATDAAHHEVDGDAGARGAVQRVDDLGIGERVQLGPDRRRSPGARLRGLRLDQLQERGAQPVRRAGQLLHRLGRIGSVRAAQVGEQARRVTAERRIAGEERQVRVEPGVKRVIVPGAVVHVGAQGPVFAPDHARGLGVGLERGEAVEDARPGALHDARRADVALLVEARLELDQHGYRLARLGGRNQRLDHGRVLGGPVQRLFDRHHLRIGGGLSDEPRDHVEAFVRVVHDDVLGADRREAVAVEVADALGKARAVWPEQEVRAVRHDQPLDVGQGEQAVEDDDVLGRDAQSRPDRGAQTRRHAGLDGQADDRAAGALLERAFEHAQQVLGLLLDLDAAVAQDPEYPVAPDLRAREEPVEIEPHDPLQAQEATPRAG